MPQAIRVDFETDCVGLSGDRLCEDVNALGVVWKDDFSRQGTLRFTVQVNPQIDGPEMQMVDSVTLGLQTEANVRFPDAKVLGAQYTVLNVLPYGGDIGFDALLGNLVNLDEAIQEPVVVGLTRTRGQVGRVKVKVKRVTDGLCDGEDPMDTSDVNIEPEALMLMSDEVVAFEWDDGDNTPRFITITPLDDNLYEGTPSASNLN